MLAAGSNTHSPSFKHEQMLEGVQMESKPFQMLFAKVREKLHV